MMKLTDWISDWWPWTDPGRLPIWVNRTVLILIVADLILIALIFAGVFD